MKIVTVNIPEAHIEVMRKLTGKNGLYPSRSELIRCAVREFLKEELERAKKNNPAHLETIKEYNNAHEETVRIPVEGEHFKTYKIIRKLKY